LLNLLASEKYFEGVVKIPKIKVVEGIQKKYDYKHVLNALVQSLSDYDLPLDITHALFPQLSGRYTIS